MLKIFGLSDWDEWKKYSNMFRSMIYWKPEFFKLFIDESSPELAIFEDERGILYYPYLKRNINTDGTSLHLGEMYDITSPYGYGGPLIQLAQNVNKKEFIKDFYHKFHKYCMEGNIVCEFIRCHPLFVEVEYLSIYVEIELNNMNVYIDIENFNDEIEIFNSYKHSNRKAIKKAQNSGVDIIVDEKGEYLEEFLSIYYHTMDRNSAGDYYYFKKEYFEKIHALDMNFIYFHAVLDGKIISTELLLYDKECIYSFLGGTISEYFSVCPNNLLKHTVIMWSKANGIRRFLLGGGHQIDDGIFNYKKSFAPNSTVNYYIGKKIHNILLYNKLCEIKGRNSTTSYFPLYRSV